MAGRRGVGTRVRHGWRDDVRAISPSEDVREAPRADLGFSFVAGARCHWLGEGQGEGDGGGEKRLNGVDEWEAT